MLLSQPLAGERVLGTVGAPLPGVQAKIVPFDGESGGGGGGGGGGGDGGGDDGGSSATGHLLVKGPGLFSEYFGRPQATAEAWDSEGWFKTGDTARRDKDG